MSKTDEINALIIHLNALLRPLMVQPYIQEFDLRPGMPSYPPPLPCLPFEVEPEGKP